jgi:hypothetical protein
MNSRGLKMRAILTFARGWNALAAARSLGRRGIEVIAGDEYAFSPTSFSKYTIASFLYPNPDRDPEGFLTRLEEVVRQYAAPGQERLLRKLVEQLAARNGPLLAVCGKPDDTLGEVWSRQLGVWMYLPGVDSQSDIALLCGEARNILTKLEKQPVHAPQ